MQKYQCYNPANIKKIEDPPMKSFDFKDVKLEDGMLKRMLDETMHFYLYLSDDSILKYLRESANKYAPGIYYTGWYPDSRGLALIGQWLSAFSRMYVISKSKYFREKALYISKEFWKCYPEALNRRPFFTSQSHYDIEKLLRAQCDLYLYCNDPNAAEHAAFLVDYALENLDTSNLFGNNMTEWYNMTESCLDVWEVFGIEKAKDLAKRFEYREYWDLFYNHADPHAKRPVAGLFSEYCQAYSHVNSFNSCAKAYEVTKDPYYLEALHSFYRFMQEDQVMATGGFGPNFEHLMPKYRQIDALRTGHDSFETQCNTYAIYRLMKYMTLFTGKSLYGNWVESLIINATAATIPMAEDGRIMYYSDYNMYGAKKTYHEESWTCCTGTWPLLLAEIQRLIYFEDQDNLYISQFVPSTLHWQRAGAEVTVTQYSRYPAEDFIYFRLGLSEPTEFTVYFRIPGWLPGTMIVCLNDEPIPSTVDENGWRSARTLWHDGDKISLLMPQELWMSSLDKEKDGPNAFLRGAVVLAADYIGLQTPNMRMDIRSLVRRMRPTPGKPLHYTVDGIETIRFRPFYEFKENEPYFLYHDTTAHASKLKYLT